MSAMYLGHSHITALIAFAVRHNIIDQKHGMGQFHHLSPTDAGKMLLEANAKAMVERYRDKVDATALQADADAYKYKPMRVDLCRPAVHIVKACQCFNYQAEDAKGYEQSQASALMDHIMSHAISALPGYDEAPWSID